MSTHRPDPAADAAALREATDRLVEDVRGTDPAALAGPSGLPGWTRGHVLAHLARNADALVNLVTWARTGEETLMYPSREARDKEIEDGAGRPLAEHLEDLAASAGRLEAALAGMPPAAWGHLVSTRSGETLPAAEIPFRRLVEVELHHVDLDTGYTAEDLPAAFAARTLDWAVDSRFHAHQGIPAVRLHDTGRDALLTLGAAPEPECTVAGSTAALLAWVTGRGRGDGLAVAPQGARLPDLPPLG